MLQALLRRLFGHTARAASSEKRDTSVLSLPDPRATERATRADAKAILVASILELRDVVASGSAPEIVEAIDVFTGKAIAYDLDELERESELAKAKRMLAVLAYGDSLTRGEGLQIMATTTDGEPAYFFANDVRRETARDEDWGRLAIGEKGMFFDGEKRLTLVWGKVLTLGVDHSSLIVHPTRGGNPPTFRMRSEREARLAHTIATTFFGQQSTNVAAATRRKRAAPPVTGPGERPSLNTLELGLEGGTCNFNIVGESQYQGRLRNISKSGRSFAALVLPEPTNAVDPNAVRVVAEGADTIGYFSREDAVHYSSVFNILGKHGRVGMCRAQLTGGAGDKRSFGVLLNLREADQLLVLLRDVLEPGEPVASDVEPF